MKHLGWLAFFFAVGSASAGTLTKPEWFMCATDADCVLVDTGCGQAGAVNKKFVKETSAKGKGVACDKSVDFEASKQSKAAKCVNYTCRASNR